MVDGDGRREYSDDEFLSAVESHPGERTGVIANEVGCTTRNALKRLKRLEERGEVSSKSVTERMKIWFPSDG